MTPHDAAGEVSPLPKQDEARRDEALSTRVTAIEETLIVLQIELRTFLSVTNGYPNERVIEGAVSRECLEEHLARYRFALPHVHDQDVLDIACGSGYGSDALLRQGGARSVHGADIDPTSIRYARARYAHERLSFHCADACEPWTDASFDVITCFETIEHVAAPERMLASFARMLRPGGLLLVSSPIRESGSLADPPRNPYHRREWSRPEFTALLGEYFGLVDLYGQRWRPRAGTGRWRLPARVTRVLLRLGGVSAAAIQRQEYEVLEREPSRFWFDPTPRVMVAVCRHPHPLRA